MSRKENLDKTVEIKDYITHHVYDLEDGHEIIIVAGEMHKERLLKFKCSWPNRKRDPSGRVSQNENKKQMGWRSTRI
jgi:hypothetical protein|tara:strand:+ start:1210 stop:1440 length:231 start_codon:yes stop_codon:yes gene_type:complete